ncbi:MAG: urease accessory protein UreF [Phycisphaerae bacterium]|nr:urease accessory UreF family protein [Tepidisphaeraceae bacterium]
MTPISDWLIYQLADSAFPGGAFAHSQGLEAAWQLGEIGGEADLVQFLDASMRQGARGGLPFALAAHEGIAHAHEGAQRLVAGRASLAEVDHRCDLFLTSEVANRASRATGRGFLATCHRSLNVEAVAVIADRLRDQRLPGHWAPVFGAVAGALGVPREQTAGLFLFVALRGTISAAVRLGIIGPIRGQAIQFSLSGLGQSLATRAFGWGMDDAAQVAPAIELHQGAHDRLYSKLFLS